MERVKLFIPLIIFVMLAIIFYLVLNNKDYDPKALPSALLNKPMPVFTLQTIAGDIITNEDVTGEPALINVWATWCISCRVEHAYLNELAQQGIKIIGIDYKDDREKAQAWLKTLGNPYQQSIFDEQGKLGLDLGVYGAPETYVVDAQGIIRYKHIGVVDANVWAQTLKPVWDSL